MAVMTTPAPPLPTLSTLQLVFIGLVAVAAYFLYSYRDGRAIGTNPRPDLVPFRSTKQTLFLGDFLTLLKEKDRLLDNFLQRQREDGHLLKADPSRAFTITLPGMRMVLISKSEVCAPLPLFPSPCCASRIAGFFPDDPALGGLRPPSREEAHVRSLPPQHIAHVQKNAFNNYRKGPLFKDVMQQVLGEQGIFVADGHQWQ